MFASFSSSKQFTERKRDRDRERGSETYAGGLRDQCQPEGIIRYFLPFVLSSYVTQICSGIQKERQSHMKQTDGK